MKTCKEPCFAGVDVSKDTFNAHWLGRDAEYSNSAKGINAFLRDVPPGSVISMEATGNYHYRLALGACAKGHRAMVFNPWKVKCWKASLEGGTSGKTDKADARTICAFAQRKDSPPRFWNPPTPAQARAKVLASILCRLAKFKNAAFSVNHAAALVVSRHDDSLHAMRDVMDVCGSYADSLERELVGIVRKAYPGYYELLVSVPGIGSKTASVLLALVGNMETFKSGRHLASFFGIAPVTRESGISVRGKGHIGKAGNSYIRALLYTAAMTAAVHSKPMREFYQRLVSGGKNGMVATVAVARKLLVIAFHVVQSGEFYSESCYGK